MKSQNIAKSESVRRKTKCPFAQVLCPEVIGQLDQFAVADSISSAMAAHPEKSHKLCMLLEPALYRCQRVDTSMYIQRKRKRVEGFLLGLVEGVLLVGKRYEQDGLRSHELLQKRFPTVFYRLLCKDGTNWDIEDKRMADRLRKAIWHLCREYGHKRRFRTNQIVAIVSAILKTMWIFRGGWHHEVCGYLAHGLLDCSFVQDQLRLLESFHCSDGEKIPDIRKKDLLTR